MLSQLTIDPLKGKLSCYGCMETVNVAEVILLENNNVLILKADMSFFFFFFTISKRSQVS